MLTGRHLIAGTLCAGDRTFASSPASGQAHDFSVGTPAHVDAACQAAETAVWSYSALPREARASATGCLAAAHELRDRTALATLREEIDAACPCTRFSGAPGNHRSAYGRCARQVRDAALADERKAWTNAEVEAAVATLRHVIASREADVRAQVQGARP